MLALGEEYVCVQDTDLASNWAELEENADSGCRCDAH